MKFLRSHLLFVAIIVIAIIALAFSLWVLVDSYGKIGNKNNNRLPGAGENKIVKTDLAINEIPEKFPADMPIEAGAKIIQNYNATTADGRFQATRVFETKKTLEENLKVYQTYLKNSGYDVKEPVKAEHFISLLAIKGKIQVQISFDENTVTKVKTVSISLTELSK